jgi:hypothetical protein
MYAVFPASVAPYVVPTMASVGVFAAFALVLRRRVGASIFGEIGFLYLGFILAYTVVPSLGFMAAGLDQLGPLSWLQPDPVRLVAHLWRHVLFEAAVAAGYLLLRGSSVPQVAVRLDRPERDRRALIVAATLIAVSITSMTVMSAPVHSYYEHFTRYDHLPWIAHKLVSLAVRSSLGLYCVLLALLFRDYARYRFVIPFVVAAICAHELIYSYGARIQALIVLLQAVCLYHFQVRRISIKAGFVACLVMATVFSVVELVRPLEADSNGGSLAETTLKPASEFGAVFLPGFHLYEERAQRALPPTEWPMFFYDAISLVTFGDFTRWNPMNWYANNYFPTVDIPPFTMGPIADSAMWGGEPDLFARGLINGMFFAYIMRWFLRRKHKWWGLTVYAYCYSTCILTVKYTIFLDLSLVEKNLIPTLLLIEGVRAVRLSWDAGYQSNVAAAQGHTPPLQRAQTGIIS